MARKTHDEDEGEHHAKPKKARASDTHAEGTTSPCGPGDLAVMKAHCHGAASALKKGDLSAALTHLCCMCEHTRVALTDGPAVYEAAGVSVHGPDLEEMAGQLEGCAAACDAAQRKDITPGANVRAVPWGVVAPVMIAVFRRLFERKG